MRNETGDRESGGVKGEEGRGGVRGSSSITFETPTGTRKSSL